MIIFTQRKTPVGRKQHIQFQSCIWLIDVTLFYFLYYHNLKLPQIKAVNSIETNAKPPVFLKKVNFFVHIQSIQHL